MADTADNKHQVKDYYDVVHRQTWARRTAGLIGGAIIGVALGGIVGAVAAFLPFIFGAMGVAGAAAVAAPTFGAVASSAGLFAGVIGLMGSAAMSIVGANAASVAAGMGEKEKRENTGEGTAPAKQAAPEKAGSMFNWKVAACTVPMMAAFGALLSLNPVTASAMTAVGFTGATATAGASSAAIAASASVFGMFGMAFGLKMSYITNKVSNWTYDLITGKKFEKSADAPACAKSQSQANVTLASDPSMMQSQCSGKKFSSDAKRFSLNGIIEKTEERVPENVLVTR